MSEYSDAAAQARADTLKSIRDTDSRIKAIYEQAMSEISAKAQSAKDGSLTQRWAVDMQTSLKSSISRLNGNLESAITGAAGQAAQLPGNTAGDWLHNVYTNAGGNLSGNTFRSMFTATSDDALRMVLSGRAYLDGKTLSQRIWSQTGRLENGINQVIQQGIAQKKSAVQIARELEQYVNPDARETLAERRAKATENKDASSYPPLQFPGNVEYNCLRLARTSINHAYFLSMKNSAKLNPLCNAVHWELSGQHFTRQVMPFGVDICDEYATHDEGLGVGNWPVDGVPLPHAQCLCSQWPEVPMSLEDCAKRLRGWLDGDADSELDSAFADWKDELESGLPNKRLSSIRDDAGEVRKELLTEIAGREDVQDMSVSEREKLFDRLNNASEKELREFDTVDIDTGARRYRDVAQEHLRRDKHAETYYESVRNRSGDAEKTSNNIGWKVEDVEQVRRHVFVNAHDLGFGEFGRFDSDYLQAQAWQRLCEGKEYDETDILLLQHELYESQLEAENIPHRQAHDIANERFNWYNSVKDREV